MVISEMKHNIELHRTTSNASCTIFYSESKKKILFLIPTKKKPVDKKFTYIYPDLNKCLFKSLNHFKYFNSINIV